MNRLFRSDSLSSMFAFGDCHTRTGEQELNWTEGPDAAVIARKCLQYIKRREVLHALANDEYIVCRSATADLSGYARYLILDTNVDALAAVLADRQIDGWVVRCERIKTALS
jgi:hypothetical protein